MRKRPPTTRNSITHKFVIRAKDESSWEGYFTVGLYKDGTPAELFVVLGKSGETLAGMARCWATCFSMCLQSGVPIERLTDKFTFFRFEPAGFTDNPDIPYAHSIADYVCRWLEKTFVVSTPARQDGEHS